MKTDTQEDTNRILVENGRLIDKAIEEGVRKAMFQHKQDGLPVVIKRNGTIEWVKPEDLGYLTPTVPPRPNIPATTLGWSIVPSANSVTLREEGNPIDRVRRLRRVKTSKAPRQRWHSWHRRQFRICKLQILQGLTGFESHPLRHTRRGECSWSVCDPGFDRLAFRSSLSARIPPSPPTTSAHAHRILARRELWWTESPVRVASAPLV